MVAKGRAMKDFEKFFEDVPSDSLSAVIGWTKWFQAAKESEIPALVRFAVQKEKRLPGLTAMPSTQSAPASSKASTTRSRSLNESATVTVMMTSFLP